MYILLSYSQQIAVRRNRYLGSFNEWIAGSFSDAPESNIQVSSNSVNIWKYFGSKGVTMKLFSESIADNDEMSDASAAEVIDDLAANDKSVNLEMSVSDMVSNPLTMTS